METVVQKEGVMGADQGNLGKGRKEKNNRGGGDKTQQRFQFAIIKTPNLNKLES